MGIILQSLDQQCTAFRTTPDDLFFIGPGPFFVNYPGSGQVYDEVGFGNGVQVNKPVGNIPGGIPNARAALGRSG